MPVSRYWREFDAVEISDTEIAIPGAGTVRRWIREAPEGFLFTMVAPKSLSDSGFRRTKENKATCEAVAELASDLKRSEERRVGKEGRSRWSPEP